MTSSNNVTMTGVNSWFARKIRVNGTMLSLDSATSAWELSKAERYQMNAGYSWIWGVRGTPPFNPLIDYKWDGRVKVFMSIHSVLKSNPEVFSEETAPGWLKSDDRAGSTVGNRWFWNDRIMKLDVGESVDTDFQTITRIS